MKKRIVTIALVVALLATCFAGSYAYLTDSHAQKNTFTTGNVYISMDEAKVVKDNAGNLVSDGDKRVEANEGQSYHLLPGMTVVKDPTIRVDAASEDAWVAAKITFTNYNALALLAGGALESADTTVVVAGNVVYIYYNTQKHAGEELVLFEKLTVPAQWDNAEMDLVDGMEILVEAYAVQANGFDSCQAAMQAAYEFPVH